MDRITLVLDASSSMGNCYTQMLTGVKSMLKAIEDNAREKKQQTKVSLITFADKAKFEFQDIDSSVIGNYEFDYHAYGNTALFDAVGLACENMKESASHLVVVFTDGQENASLTYSVTKINNIIESKQKTGKWTFAFNVPPNGKSYLERFGIPSDNIREWESHNKESVTETVKSNVSSLNTYFNARSMGLTSVDRYYTDLKDLKRADVRKELDNISKDYSQVQVNTEGQIRDIVKGAGYTYRKGIAFYELVKPELVQENKQILVMENGKNAIWGGKDARDLIGIPAGRVKVIPKNHAKFRIFVQSTSVNRKTVTGTTILVKN